jgi:hypothetical protein
LAIFLRALPPWRGRHRVQRAIAKTRELIAPAPTFGLMIVISDLFVAEIAAALSW